MKWALGIPGLALLQSWIGKRPLLALDFDGTLAPIVSQPDHAALPASTRPLLRTLAARSPCVVISGRARADVSQRLKGIGLAEIIGNHGSEPWLDLQPLREWTAQAIPKLQQRLGSLSGVEIEDKKSSISIHYRRAFLRQEAIDTIQDVAASLQVGTLIPGKYVISLLPPGAYDKGQGLLRAMDVLKQQHALYIGDDATDEPAFALCRQRRVLGIRVGHHRDSAAKLYLKTQREVEPLLRILLDSGWPSSDPKDE